MVGHYCSYLLPKQEGGTSQIKVNPAQVRHQMGHPVKEGDERPTPVFAAGCGGTRGGGSGLHKRWFSFRAEELERHPSRNKGGFTDEPAAT